MQPVVCETEVRERTLVQNNYLPADYLVLLKKAILQFQISFSPKPIKLEKYKYRVIQHKYANKFQEKHFV